MTAERYYVKRPSGKVFGPFDKNAIGMMLKSKKLDLDAEVSQDKDQWLALTQVAEFAQIVSDMGAPVDLPAPAGVSGLPGLSKPPGSDLPSPVSGSGGTGLDLPKPISHNNLDLPKPLSTPDLPSPVSGGGLDLPRPVGGGMNNLPRPGAPPNLPTPGAAPNLPNVAGSVAVDEEDLFGSPMSAVEEEDDLFGSPVSQASEDDLFGAPASSVAMDDDLFGGPVSSAHEEDLFGAPASQAASTNANFDGYGNEGSNDFGNVDFGPSNQDLDEDSLFGSGGDGNDLFGGPSDGVSLNDDLFGDAGLEGDDDDFLGGEQGFSFLDESPTGSQGANVDSWGDDLISQNGPPSADPFMGNSTEDAFTGNSVGLDHFSEPSRSTPQPATPQATAPADPFRPASTGIQAATPEAAKPGTGKTGAPDEDKKRGMAVKIGLPILIFLVLGGIGFALFKVFGNQDVAPVAKTKVAKRVRVDLAKLQTANFAELREIINTSKKASMKPDAVGKVLVAHALVLSQHKDDAVLKNAQKLIGKVSGAKSDNAQLGKGAFDAVTSDYDSAKASLEPLASKDGEVGLFANLFLGIAASRAATTAANDNVPKKDAPKKEDAPAKEDAPKKKDAPKAKEDATKAPDAPKVPVKKAVVVDSETLTAARKHLDAAKKINTVLPSYWLGQLDEKADKTKSAIANYKRSLKASEEYVPSLVAMGRLLYDKGDLNDAMKRLEKVTTTLSAYAHNKDKAVAYYYSGKVYAARSQSDLAIKNYTKALEFDTSRTDTLRDLANEYERAKKYKEALNFFTTNKNLGEKDPDVILGIVRAYKGLKQWERAIAQLEVGEKNFPEDARFPEQLGQLNMSRGTFTEARKAFERAVEIDPSILAAHASLAQLAWLMDKDFERGEKHIRKIVTQPKQLTAPVSMQVAEFYRISERSKVSQQWYSSAIRRDPNFWPARLALAKLLLEQGKTKSALNLLERSRKEGVKDIRLSAYLADAYRQSKMYDRAIDEINRVIEKFPKNPRYIFIRGRIYFDRGNYETALEDFNKAYELDTRFHDAYFFVGRTAFAQGDVKTAMKIFRHVLDYVPNNGDYRFYMGRALENQGRMTQALEEYRKVTEVEASYGVRNPVLYVVRGRLMGKLSYVREGRKDIARALELAPNNVDALVAMGEVDFNEKQYNDAVKNFTKALAKDVKRPDAQQKLGMSYIYLKRANDGAKHLQLAIRYGYKDPDIYRTLGYLYKDLGQRKQALDAFKAFWKKSAGKKGVPRGTQREVLLQIKELGG